MMNYAEYHARCWAEGKTRAELQTEVDFLNNRFPTRQWNEVGNAHNNYVRLETLKRILAEDTL